MRLWSEPARSDVRIAFRANPLPIVNGESQRVRILVNGRMIAEMRVTHLADYSVVVPRETWNAGPLSGQIDLEWELPDSCRLSAQPGSESSEGRLLGICLRRLKFELVTQ
jgi:hypothetical protein